MAAAAYDDTTTTTQRDEIIEPDVRHRETHFEKLQKKTKTVNCADIYGAKNHAVWVNLLRIYTDICSNNGIIYGGSIRDFIDRTEHSTKYFKTMAEKGFKYAIAKQYKYFNNPEVDKETFSQRTLLPKDIDVYCFEEHFEKIIKVTEQYFTVKELNIEHLQYREIFKDKLTSSAIIYKRFELDCFDANFKHGTKTGKTILDNILNWSMVSRIVTGNKIFMDLLILRKEFCDPSIINPILLPPFGKPEFLCNMICMKQKNFGSIIKTKDNSDIVIEPLIPNYLDIILNTNEYSYSWCKALYNVREHNKILEMIISDIINKQARLVGGNINIHRTMKMIYKNYKIDTKFLFNKITHGIHTFNQDTNTHIRHIHNCNYEHVIDIPNPSSEDEEEKCPICLDNFNIDKIQVNWGCQCSAKYHRKCLVSFVASIVTKQDYNNDTKCPNCRRHVNCICDIANILQLELLYEKYKDNMFIMGFDKSFKLIDCNVHHTEQFAFCNDITTYRNAYEDLPKKVLFRNLNHSEVKRKYFLYLQSRMPAEMYLRLFGTQVLPPRQDDEEIDQSIYNSDVD
jgi:hypothetical protein